MISTLRLQHAPPPTTPLTPLHCCSAATPATPTTRLLIKRNNAGMPRPTLHDAYLFQLDWW